MILIMSDTPLSLDDFAPRITTACTVCQLPSDVRVQMETARLLDPQRFTYPVIARWLSSLSFKVGEDSLRRHVKRHAAERSVV